MGISDWRSDVCSSDLPVDNACPDQRLAAGPGEAGAGQQVVQYGARRFCSLGESGLRDLPPIGACFRLIALIAIGRAPFMARVCQYGYNSWVAVSLIQKTL